MHESSNDISYQLQQLSGWLYDGRGGYSLGYLLRKLPYKVKDEYQFNQYGVRLKQTGGGWVAYYGEPGNDSEIAFSFAKTPEDAVAMVAIELLKSGVLPSEHSTAKPLASPKKPVEGADNE